MPSMPCSLCGQDRIEGARVYQATGTWVVWMGVWLGNSLLLRLVIKTIGGEQGTC